MRSTNLFTTLKYQLVVKKIKLTSISLIVQMKIINFTEIVSIIIFVNYILIVIKFIDFRSIMMVCIDHLM